MHDLAVRRPDGAADPARSAPLRPRSAAASQRKPAIWLLALVLFAAAVRLTGLNWDQRHHFHPDERAISEAVGRLSFDLRDPQLNPKFFAYGSLPLYITGMVTTVLGWVEPAVRNYDDRILVGRAVSGVAGTLTVLLLALLGFRLHGRAVGLLAGLLLAACALHVQNSHFMTTDVFLTFTVLAALFFLVRLAEHGRGRDYVFSGLAIGFSAATKFSALPLLAPLGVVILIRVYRERRLFPIAGAVLALTAAAAAFALGQPYALLDFPTFWRHINEQSQMVRNAGLLPYTNQYRGAPKYFYDLQQMVLWGMAPPLGIAAIAATGVFAVRAIRKASFAHLVLLSWVVPYFLVTGWFEVKFPRYLLPIYPVLILWAAAWLWEGAQRSVAWRLGLWTVVAGTLAALLALLSVYQRPHTIVTASEWVYQHIPAGSTILTQHWDEGFPFSLPGRPASRYTIEELPYYEPDTPAKVRGLAAKLANGDYIAFQTKRLYGAITQAADKYPLTNNYFHLLFAGDLGYTLIYDHDARPSLFGIEIPDELADESLTVYDHPKVLIFRNTEHLAEDEIYSRIMVGRPSKKLTRSDLLLAEAGRQGVLGTPEAPPIRSGWLALLWFGIAIEVIGFAAHPIIRRWLPVPGSHAMAKVLGILVFAFVPWLLASTGLALFTQATLAATLAILVVAGLVSRRSAPRAERKDVWATEALFWGTFAFFLAVRAFNPEVFWGEKPMDFSFLNTLTRSTKLPPPEPWAAGYTLHYSYFGHYIVAALGKLCHIHPGITFNLGIALFAGLTASAAYALGCAVATRRSVGLLAAFFATLIGNLAGIREYVARQSMGFDYFWATSRVIKDTINEYPLWSFLFADLHAHVLVMPFSLTFLALSFWWVRSQLHGWADDAVTNGPAIASSDPGSGRPAEALPITDPPEAPSHPDPPLPTDEAAAFWGVEPYTDAAAGTPAPAAVTAPPADAIKPATSEPAARQVARSRPLAEPDLTAAEVRRSPTLLLLGLALGCVMVTNTWSTFTYVPFFPFLLGVAYIGSRGVTRFQLTGSLMVLVLAAALIAGKHFLPPLSLAGMSVPQIYDIGTAGVLGLGALLLFPRIAVPSLLVAGIAAVLYLPYLTDWSAPERNWGWERDSFAHFYDFANIFGLFLFIAATFLFAIWRRQLLPTGASRLGAARAIAMWLVGLAILLSLLLTIPFAELTGSEDLRRFLHIGALSTKERAHQFAIIDSVRIGLALLAVVALHLALQRSLSSLHRRIAILFSFAFFVTAGVDVLHVWDRMNTVFKFYLESWFLFAAAGAAATFELWRGVIQSALLRRLWQTCLVLLIAAGLFTAATITAGVLSTNRVRTPRPTLDGTAYLSLRDPHEAAAFEWLNREVAGIPVIAEAYGPSYQDFARVTMNTGLPTVLGWDYHVHQRTVPWPVIEERKSDLKKLYTAESKGVVSAVLKKYHVSLVYVGPLERRTYSGGNLKRFQEWNDVLTPLYQNASVTIFGVTGQFTGARPITTIEEVFQEGIEQPAEQAPAGQYRQPRGIAVDSKGNVYVADFDNHRIQKLSPELEVLASWGEQGNLPGQFKQPCEVAVDRNDVLYVADTWNQRVQVLTSDGEYVREWGGGFFGPRGITVGANGKIYVVDTGNHRVRRFRPEGVEELTWGGLGSAPGQFKEPYGVAADAEGHVYVTDNGNSRLQIFDPDGNYVDAFPVKGWRSEVFSEPKVALTPDGTIWVTVPLEGVVRGYDRAGRVVREITGKEMPMGLFQKPLGIAYSERFHELFVTDLENRIARLPLPVK